MARIHRWSVMIYGRRFAWYRELSPFMLDGVMHKRDTRLLVHTYILVKTWVPFQSTKRNLNYVITSINSSSHSTPFMRQWIWSALVQIMACRQFGAKPLSKPMLVYCQLVLWEQTSVKILIKFFHARTGIWKYHLRKGGHFVRGICVIWYKRCLLALRPTV